MRVHYSRILLTVLIAILMASPNLSFISKSDPIQFYDDYGNPINGTSNDNGFNDLGGGGTFDPMGSPPADYDKIFLDSGGGDGSYVINGVTWFYKEFKTGSGVWTVPAGVTKIDVLAVGGGGGTSSVYSASYYPGGGGAGGLVWVRNVTQLGTTYIFPGNDISFTVGTGGLGINDNGLEGGMGGDSIFGNLTAKGGGGGGGPASATHVSGLPGGSGGGGSKTTYTPNNGGSSTQSSQTGWSGSKGFGNAGAAGSTTVAAGGGGANAAGSGATGGAGKDMSAFFGTTWGVSGVFSAGGYGQFSSTGSAGAVNSGNGGNAPTSTTYYDSGGSGIILVRWTGSTSKTWYLKTLTSGSGSWTIPTGVNKFDVLVVGGGGGAGMGATTTTINGGGGGAGGLTWMQDLTSIGGYKFESATSTGLVRTVYGAVWDGQTFTIGTTGSNYIHTVTSIKMLIARVGSPGTLTVSIRATSGGLPTGGDLASGSVNGNGLSTSSTWVEIPMSAYQLSASTMYAIVARVPSGDLSNYISWTRGSSPAYSGGTMIESSDSGGSFSTMGYDFSFEEWGAISITPGYTIAYSVGGGGAAATAVGSTGTTGTKSTFGNFTAWGGGGGGSSTARTALTGGSGGGAGVSTTSYGTGGTGNQTTTTGWSGKYGFGKNGVTTSVSGFAGGGGGAKGAGTGIAGGYGKILNELLSKNYGQAGVFSRGGNAHSNGAAGLANSGNGGNATATNIGTAGGAGGSGIIIIRWERTSNTFTDAAGKKWCIIDLLKVIGSSGTWTVPYGLTKIDVLAVGGGGGTSSTQGSYYPGGGGAGGLVWVCNATRLGTTDIVAGNTISFTIGAGGTGQSDAGLEGGMGGDSIFGNLTAKGGGGGGGPSNSGHTPGLPGGSGGGGSKSVISFSMLGGSSTQSSQSGWSGINGFGYAGGTGTTSVAAGGGGANAAGSGATGGAGKSMSAFFGTTWGVSGVFAAGGYGQFSSTGSDGAADTGNGGNAPTGAGNYRAGGSGIILLRWQVKNPTVTTNSTTGVSYTNSTLYGYLSNLGNDSSATCRFQYGTTTGYGSSTTNQTKTATGTFLSNVFTVIGNDVYTSYNNVGSTQGDGEYFSFPSTCSLDSVSLLLYRTGTPGTVTAYLKLADSSGLPTGSVLASGSINGDSITTDTNGLWYNFSMPYTLTGGTKYAVYLLGGASGSQLYIKYSNANPWSYGARVYYDAGWSVIPTNDDVFRLNTASYGPAGLSAGTLYHYRSAVTNVNGTGYGSDAVFLTKPNNMTGFASTKYSSTQINLTWSNGAGGAGAYIEYATGTAPSPWNKGSGTTVNATGNILGTSFAHSGLSAGQHYYYKAWAIGNSGGQKSDGSASKPYGNAMTSDLILTSTPIVTTNSATGLKTTNATLWGTLTSDGGLTCTVRFQYGLTTSYGMNTTNQTKSSGQTFSINQGSLTPSKTYHYRAVAINSNGVSYGSDMTFFTGYFISTWDTTKSGTSNSTSITLPLILTGSYNFVCKWGDGTQTTITSYTQATHWYGAGNGGVKTVNITGLITGWRFNYGGDRLKITGISSWGPLNVGNLGTYFYGCSNLVCTATDALDLTGTTNLDSMFGYCSNFNGAIGNWDTSKVTVMSSMFYVASTFNQNIGSWNTANVTTMSNMFNSASAFNQNIGSWNTAKVTAMGSMFTDTSAFNQNIGSWNTKNVTTMQAMFQSASAFNQNLSLWNVSAVTNLGFVSMFQSATSFNSSVSNWVIKSTVTSFSNMFNGATKFSKPINWNTNNVVTLTADNMFYGATKFNSPITFNTGKISDMSGMFQSASSFNQSIDSWVTSKVITMQNMFRSATSFNQNLNSWNTVNVTTMQAMFQSASKFNGNIGSWNTAKVTLMSSMFYGATVFNQNIGSWNTASAINMWGMFQGDTAFNQNIGSWNTKNVTYTYQMFYGATAFNQNIGSWNTSKVIDMNNMFYGATSFNQNIGSWKTSSVTNMWMMFQGATSFNQNIGGWDVTKVTNMGNMFNGVTLSTANYDSLLIGWGAESVTSSVTFSGGNSKYTPGGSAATARAHLISAHSWTITDGGALLAPTVTTNSTTGILATNATLWGYLSSLGDASSAWCRFQYGTTTSYGMNTSNVIKTSIGSFSAGPVDRRYDGQSTADANALVLYGAEAHGQTFSQSTSNLLKTIELSGKRGGSPGTIRIDIYATSGGKPTGSSLGYGTFNGNSLSTSQQRFNISLVSPVTTTGGTQYSFVIRVNSGDGDNYALIYYKTSNVYSNGTRVYSSDNGSTWTTPASDLFFNLYTCGLTSGQFYHYRAVANNTIGTVFGSDKTFLTKPTDPSGLTVSFSGNGFSLSWTHGTGYNNSVVRGQIGSYPSTPQSGTAIYNGSGSTCAHSGLTIGDTWYYSVWEYTTWGGLSQFSFTSAQNNKKYVQTATVATNATTGVMATNATLWGYLSNSGTTITNATEDQYITSDSGGSGIFAQYYEAQTFSTANSYYINKVTLKMYKGSGTNPGTVTVSIRATSSNLPTGSDLITGTIDGNSFTTSANGAWYDIPFTNVIKLTGGVKYAIVVTCPVEGINWRLHLTGTYANGTECSSINYGSTWSSGSAYDHAFYVYGTNDFCFDLFQYGATTGYGLWTTSQWKTVKGTFSQNTVSLNPGQLYHYRAIANNTNGTGYGSDRILLTKPNALTGFTATKYNSTRIDLSWSNGAGGDGAYVEYATGSAPSPWNLGSGTKLVTAQAPSSSSGITIYGARWVAQTFTETGVEKITGISIYAQKTANPGTVTASIRATSGIQPTGSDLVSATSNSASWSSGWGWRWFNFTTPYTTSNAVYAILVRATSGDGSNYIDWAYTNGNPYKGGGYDFSSNSGSTWDTTSYYDTDCSFKVYSPYAAGTSIHHQYLTAGPTYYYKAWSYAEDASNLSDGSATKPFGDNPMTANAGTVSSPTVTTNATTGVMATNATLWGYLSNLGDISSAWCRFQYGTTTGYGSSTVNQTKTSTGKFSDGLSGGTDSFTQLYGGDGYTDWNFTVNINANGYITELRDEVYNTGVTVYASIRDSSNNILASKSVVTTDYFTDVLWSFTPSDYTRRLQSGETVTVRMYSLVSAYLYTGAGTTYTGTYVTVPAQSRIPKRYNSGTFVFLKFQATLIDSGKLYHYRAVANNTVGTSFGSDMMFLTKPTAPTNLLLSFSSSGFSLSWTHGTGYNNSVVRGQIGSYPSTPQSGTAIYNGSSNTCTHSSLTQGNTWYYSVWEYTTWGGLSQFSSTPVQNNKKYLNTPTVTTSSATGVLGTNATLRGTLTDDGGESSTVRFNYGATTSYGSNTSDQSKTTGQSFLINQGSLSKGTLYHYRAYAFNARGGGYGSDSMFLTKPDPLTGLTATKYSSTQINITWSNGAGGAGAYIEYATGTAPSPWNKGSGTTVNATGNILGTSFAHSGLSAGQHYYYKAWAIGNSGGQKSDGSVTKPYGDSPMTVDVTTNQVPNAPSNPLCESQVNPTKILSFTPTLSWTFSDPDGGDTQGGYNIRVGTTAGSGNLWNTTVTSSSQSVVYGGSTLSPGVTYHWSVRTNDTHASTMGQYCGDQTFKINSVPSATLTSPANQTVGNTLTPTLGWSYSDADTDAQTNYHVQLSKYYAFNSTVINVNTSGSNIQYVVPSPLSNGTKYYWRVQLKDGYQWSAWTAIWNFDTTNLQVKDLTTYNSNYVPTSTFVVNNKAVIQYNVTNILNMNNTYITITDPLGTKRVDHQGVASVQENFTTDTKWDEDVANQWNPSTGFYVSSPKSYQHGANGGSANYNNIALVKTSVLSNQTNVTIEVKFYIDYSGEDMQRILVRYKDANNYVACYASKTYSVLGIEERIGGVRYFEETSRLFNMGTWYTMKLVLEGSTAKVYIDGVLLVTKTRLSTTNSGRIGIGCDTGWIYFDDFYVGYPYSRVVKAIPTGWQYEFNYTIPNDVSLVGTWSITANAEQNGQTASQTKTFDVVSTAPVVKNITTFNTTFVPKTVFINGDTVIIRSWIVDRYGRPAITNCNITIKNSVGTTKVSQANMWKYSDITNGAIYQYNYTIPHETASNGAWNLTVKVKNNRSYSTTSYGSFTDDIGSPVFTVKKTYDDLAVEKTLFSLGNQMKIRATVTDAKGRSNLTGCNITLTAPNGTKMLTNATMTDIGNVTNGNIYNYDYTLPGITNAFGTWTITFRAKDYYYTTVSTSHFVLEWADTHYYHRAKLSLKENFSIDRTHELLGTTITLPTAVCGGNSTIKVVNERGETMPFSILKKSGTTYYIGYVANISSGASLDYYIYYNVTGTTPSSYTTFASASNNNLTLHQSNYTQVYAPLSSNITYGKAVTASDINGDGKPEIIWVGRTGSGGGNKAFLAVYNTTWSTPATAQLHQLAYIEWNKSGYGQGFAYTVNVTDLDNDGIKEIITGGTVYNGTKNMAQLRIWNYTGGTLHLEKESIWYNMAAGDTSIFGLICFDANNDGTKEILTAGTTGTNNARGQFAVHTYTSNGGNINHVFFDNYSLAPTTGRNWTEFYAIAAGDIYNNGGREVIVGGDTYDSSGTINAILRIYRYYSGSWHDADWTKNWYDSQLSEVFSIAIGDANQDGKYEFVTSGNYFDGTRDVAQYKVWGSTGGGYPATLTALDTQSWYTYGYSSALTTLIKDINKDGLNDIITVGFQNDNVVDRGDYRIRRYDGTTTKNEHTELWMYEFARRSGDFFDAACISDLNNDGFYELIDTGRYALTPPAGTYLRVQSVSGVGQTVATTADNHGEVLPPHPPSPITKISGNRTSSSIGYSWTKASDANSTVVIYKKGSYPTSVTDGTLGFNNTASLKNFTGLNPGTHYYFKFYSWRTGSGAFSKEQGQSDDYTNPGAPTGFDASSPTSSSIHLAWTKGTNATTTYVVRKTGSSPTSRTDGTFVYNDTGSSTESNGLDRATLYYYRAWSYDGQSGYYSSDSVSDTETTLAVSPTVTTNAATGVQTLNATLHGYLNDDGGKTCIVGFYYDTVSNGQTDNVSVSGTFTTGNSFQKNTTVLSKGQLYYFKAWAKNADYFLASSNELTFLTKTDAPTGLSGSTTNNNISFTWTKATGIQTVGTMVRYQTGSTPTTRTAGSLAYNDTGASSQVSASPDTHYYLSAWSWVSSGGLFQWSDAYTTWDVTTKPTQPSSINAASDVNLINISWTKGGENYLTVIARNASGTPSYPSLTNGTIIYNDTLSYYTDYNLSTGVNYYYSLWSYNTTTGLYSARSTQTNQTQFSTLEIVIEPSELDFGTVLLNSYEETNNHYFNITNNGMTCDVDIKFNDSQNWTAVVYSELGHNKFAMNWSNNNWSNEGNIDPIYGTLLVRNLMHAYLYPFDLKVIMPTSSSTSHEQSWVMTFIVTPS